MINKLIYVGLIFGISACSIKNPYLAKRSDFTSANASLTRSMDLLNNDKQEGITRNLKKITEEIVDSNNKVHQKTITIKEELKLQDAFGKAEAVLVYDSANKTRSGKRSITLSDDGSGSLSQIVKNFEISKYKSIQNDQFKLLPRKTKTKTTQNTTFDKAIKGVNNSKKITPSALPDILTKNNQKKIKQNPTLIHAWLQ